MLDEQPGLRTTRLGGLGSFSALSIRGSTTEQVLVFVDADVCPPRDWLTRLTARLGSVAAAREAGKYRLEGKEYVFRDGDVALFRFNT